MPTNYDAFDDYYTTMLGAQPELAYMGAVSDTPFMGTDPMQRRAHDYYRGQFSDIYNQYLGTKAKEYKNRVDPSEMTSFTDYLADLPFTQRYSQSTQAQRGVGTRQFSPSTRYIFF